MAAHLLANILERSFLSLETLAILVIVGLLVANVSKKLQVKGINGHLPNLHKVLCLLLVWKVDTSDHGLHAISARSLNFTAGINYP